MAGEAPAVAMVEAQARLPRPFHEYPLMPGYSAGAKRAKVEEGFEDISEDKDCGLLKKILVEGAGDECPPRGSSVEVHYMGTLHSDGSKFDSSRDRPGVFKFDVGVGQVIRGWDEGICTMKKGEKAILRCSSDYAYGDGGSPPKIPGGATLNFEVELFTWKEKVKPPSRMAPEEREAHAAKMKEAGTVAFKLQDWATAVNRYEDAAEYITYVAGKGGHGGGGDHGHSHGGKPCSGHHDESDSSDGEGGAPKLGEVADLSEENKKFAIAVLNNCAMARLKLGDAEMAKFDCTKVLQYDEQNVKAFFRRGQAELAMGNFTACVEDAAKAAGIDPENKEAEQLRRKALDAQKKAKQKEKAMCSKMFG